MRYRRKLIQEIDAIQFTGANAEEVITFAGGSEHARAHDSLPDRLVVVTHAGDRDMESGDYLTKRTFGEGEQARTSLLPMPAAMFERLHEPAEDE